MPARDVVVKLSPAGGDNSTWDAKLTDGEGNATFMLVPKWVACGVYMWKPLSMDGCFCLPPHPKLAYSHLTTPPLPACLPNLTSPPSSQDINLPLPAAAPPPRSQYIASFNYPGIELHDPIVIIPGSGTGGGSQLEPGLVTGPQAGGPQVDDIYPVAVDYPLLCDPDDRLKLTGPQVRAAGGLAGCALVWSSWLGVKWEASLVLHDPESRLTLRLHTYTIEF